MVIPDEAFWSGVGFVIAWLVKHETQIMSRPTRSELENRVRQLQESNREAIESSVAPLRASSEKIERLLQSNVEQTQLHRTLVGDSLAEIRTNVAVLTERMNLAKQVEHPHGPRRSNG